MTLYINIVDDIIIYGTVRKAMTKNLYSLMKRAEEYGIVFNADKCIIVVTDINCFGLTY